MKNQDLETSRIQSSRTRRKHAVSGFLGITMRGDSPAFTLDFQTHEFWCWETRHIQFSDLKPLHPVRQNPIIFRCYLLSSNMPESSVNHSNFKLGQFLWVMVKDGVVRCVNSMGRNPLLHSSCCEMSSLIRCSVVKNALMVDQAFWKSTDDDASSLIWAEKANSHPQDVCIPVRTNCCPFLDGKDLM